MTERTFRTAHGTLATTRTDGSLVEEVGSVEMLWTDGALLALWLCDTREFFALAVSEMSEQEAEMVGRWYDDLVENGACHGDGPLTYTETNTADLFLLRDELVEYPAKVSA